MGEWLKELSLFDHLLHGLFKFIGETASVSGRREELEGMSMTSFRVVGVCPILLLAVNLSTESR